MNKLKNYISLYWKDPVWSGVISGVILLIIGSIGSVLYIIIKSLYLKIPFKDSFNKLITFFQTKNEISNYIITIFILFYIIINVKPFLRFLKKIKERKKDNNVKKELPIANEHSTTLFNYRVSSTFPGVRGLEWFNNSVEAVNRLEILLQEPIKFKSKFIECESDPIWWFRGSSAMTIYNFSKLGKNKILINNQQLKIKKIAVNHGNSYFKDFVYVECEGEKQTGLYEYYNKEDINRHIDTLGYSSEEYGVFKTFFGIEKKVKRQDYEDGATVVRGKVKNILNNSELRTRYLTSYNFIIAAKGSPYNSNKFSRNTEEVFNKILKKESKPEELFDFLNTFYKDEQ